MNDAGHDAARGAPRPSRSPPGSSPPGALFLVLHLHLLSALLWGLAAYELVHVLGDKLPFIRGRREAGKRWAVVILAMLVVAALTLAVVGIIAFFRGRGALASLPALLGQMADILETSKGHLPTWLAARDPGQRRRAEEP